MSESDYTDAQMLFDLEREAQRDRLELDHGITYGFQIVNATQTRPAWLFQDFLLSRTLTLISAEPFAGKSMLMLAMHAALDLQEPLFGRHLPEIAQKCLFLGQDSPAWDYEGQYQKLVRGMTQLPEPHLPSIFMFNRGLDILDPGFPKFLEEMVDAFNLTVVFLDTLIEFHNQNENLNHEMKPVMRLLKELRRKHDQIGRASCRGKV